MGERTARDDEKIRVSDRKSINLVVRTLLWKKFVRISLVVCPECTARAKKKILTKYEEEVPEEDRDRQDLYKLYDEVDIPMEMDKNTKNFICKKCGLYATREQISDIRYKLNQKESYEEIDTRLASGWYVDSFENTKKKKYKTKKVSFKISKKL